MLEPRILHRYLFREMVGPFFISLGVFTIMLLIAKIMELTDLVVTRGVGLSVVGRLLVYTLPYFFVFTVPMSTLLAVLLGFLRLTGDNEITAIKAAGISPVALMPPVAALALLAWFFASSMAFWGLPWGNHNFENLIYKVASSKADLALKERVFLTSFPGLVIYINRLPGEGNLEDVFIVDERDPEKSHTIVAKRGKLFPATGGKIVLRLYDGTVHAVGKKLHTAQTAAFATYDVAMDAGNLQAAQRTTKHEKEMYASELMDELDRLPPDSKRYYLVQMELQKKFSLPFACLVMPLLGLSLGLHSRGGRSWGIALALVLFLAYYMLLSAAWSFGETGAYPPVLGMWVPNILFGALGAEMFRREIKEQPLPILDALGSLPDLVRRLRQRFGV